MTLGNRDDPIESMRTAVLNRIALAGGRADGWNVSRNVGPLGVGQVELVLHPVGLARLGFPIQRERRSGEGGCEHRDEWWWRSGHRDLKCRRVRKRWRAIIRDMDSKGEDARLGRGPEENATLGVDLCARRRVGVETEAQGLRRAVNV